MSVLVLVIVHVDAPKMMGTSYIMLLPRIAVVKCSASNYDNTQPVGRVVWDFTVPTYGHG